MPVLQPVYSILFIISEIFYYSLQAVDPVLQPVIQPVDPVQNQNPNKWNQNPTSKTLRPTADPTPKPYGLRPTLHQNPTAYDRPYK